MQDHITRKPDSRHTVQPTLQQRSPTKGYSYESKWHSRAAFHMRRSIHRSGEAMAGLRYGSRHAWLLCSSALLQQEALAQATRVALGRRGGNDVTGQSNAPWCITRIIRTAVAIRA